MLGFSSAQFNSILFFPQGAIHLYGTGMSVQVVGTTSLTLNEGDPEQAVRIRSNFPPAAICPNSTDPVLCTLSVMAAMPEVDSDLYCPQSGGLVPQAVLQWASEEQSGCDLRLTGSNWQTVHTLLVRATIDSKKDGDQRRDLSLSVGVSVNVTYIINTVQVCGACLTSDWCHVL